MMIIPESITLTHDCNEKCIRNEGYIRRDVNEECIHIQECPRVKHLNFLY
jgi:hypothetical protein